MVIYRVIIHVENMENSGNWIVVREKSGKVIITILQLRERKILRHFLDIEARFTSLFFSNQCS